MPYITRDENNQVVALHAEAPMDEAEYLAVNDQDVINFLNSNPDDKDSLQFLSSSDYELVRVLEDLVELLIDKNIILFTELPAAAQSKLLQRRHVRRNLGDDNPLLVDEEGIF